MWNNLYNNLLLIETLELHCVAEFSVLVWWSPSVGSDETDEEMVADEETGDGAIPRHTAMEWDFLCCEWMCLMDGPLVSFTLPMSPAGVFLVEVWCAPSEGSDEEMVADEEMGEVVSPTKFRHAAMECDFLCCEWKRLVDGPLISLTAC